MSSRGRQRGAQRTLHGGKVGHAPSEFQRATDDHRFGVPVCPHAGGVGLCEYVIHLRRVQKYFALGGTERLMSIGA